MTDGLRLLSGTIAKLALAVAMGLSLVNTACAANRLAFVVGNDGYKNVDPLKKAVNDARAIARGVQSIGFSVTLSENLSRRDFNARFTAFENSVGPGDTVFLFYSGHGIEIDGANYLIPVDAPKISANQMGLLKDESISTDNIIQRLKARGTALQVIVLDACRENPFRDSTGRSIGPAGTSLRPPPASPGLFVIYSAGNGEVALDRLSDNDTNPNSVFTRSFLPLLTNPSRSLISIAKETRAKVKRLSLSVGMTQLPGYYDQTDGDVFLARGQQLAFAPAPSAGVTAPRPAVVSTAPPNLQKGIGRPPQTAGFIFADSHRRLLTREQLRGLSSDELRIARNEIYARRGRFFRDKALTAHFSRFDWYRPHAWDVTLNTVESANVKLIQSMER